MLKTTITNFCKHIKTSTQIRKYYTSEILSRVIPTNIITKDNKLVDIKADLLVKFKNTDIFEKSADADIKKIVTQLSSSVINSYVKKELFSDLNKQKLTKDVMHEMSEEINVWSGDVVKFDITTLKLKD